MANQNQPAPQQKSGQMSDNPMSAPKSQTPATPASPATPATPQTPPVQPQTPTQAPQPQTTPPPATTQAPQPQPPTQPPPSQTQVQQTVNPQNPPATPAPQAPQTQTATQTATQTPGSPPNHAPINGELTNHIIKLSPMQLTKIFIIIAAIFILVGGTLYIKSRSSQSGQVEIEQNETQEELEKVVEEEEVSTVQIRKEE